MSINQFTILGITRANAVPVGQGTYSKIVLDCSNEKTSRTDVIEVVGKANDLNSIRAGSLVCCSGSIGGKQNDKGYTNLSLFAMSVVVCQEPTGSKAGFGYEDEDEAPPY